MPAEITVRGARLHNLKNITIKIPKNRLVVLTGISGSGKSTLGFDILYKEGQRQYLESLGLVEFGLARPPVDEISGLSPTISVDQHLTNHSPRSTVGTVTDVFTYLRVLYARLGHRPCPSCGKDLPPVFDPVDIQWMHSTVDESDDSALEANTPCPNCGTLVPAMTMANFSFNKPEGACPTCTGLGFTYQADTQKLVDEDKSIIEGAVFGWNAIQINYHVSILQAAAAYYGFEFDLTQRVKEYTSIQRDLLLYGVESSVFQSRLPGKEPPATVRQGRFEGLATSLLRRYAEHIHEPDYRENVELLLVRQTCPDCEGTRLRPESRSVTIDGLTITAASKLALTDLGDWLRELSPVGEDLERQKSYAAGGGSRQSISPPFNQAEAGVAAPVLSALLERIDRLAEVGAGYLTLERASPTLSAGEAQRLRLASLLGSGLTGVLYVFDEPTIGLHQRDTRRLIGVLRKLRDLENTVLVIEHDLEMITSADYVIDFGPGAGKHGGQVVAAGTPAQVATTAGSLTGDYLSRRVSIPLPARRRPAGERALTIIGAHLHNLKNITVHIPLGLLIAVTGVSGSGKSTLVFEVLDTAIRQKISGGRGSSVYFDQIDGLEWVSQVITINQEHLHRIPRSNAATYTEVYTHIRSTFTATEDARKAGLSTRHFSFNVPGGRCERCEGAGVLNVHMQLLPDMEVRCPVCHGKRFKPEILAIKYRGMDISQVLDMTVMEALAIFQDIPPVRSRLQVLADVGLGYLLLGQPATTLSGGEAQRVKLAKELGRRAKGHTLYLLDEPTTGLHMADTALLVTVLQRLVDAGNSVVVVEHNLELVKAVDWIIDLGPEGGAAGGWVVAEGTPEQLAQTSKSFTGQYLKELRMKI